MSFGQRGTDPEDPQAQDSLSPSAPETPADSNNGPPSKNTDPLVQAPDVTLAPAPFAAFTDADVDPAQAPQQPKRRLKRDRSARIRLKETAEDRDISEGDTGASPFLRVHPQTFDTDQPVSGLEQDQGKQQKNTALAELAKLAAAEQELATKTTDVHEDLGLREGSEVRAESATPAATRDTRESPTQRARQRSSRIAPPKPWQIWVGRVAILISCAALFLGFRLLTFAPDATDSYGAAVIIMDALPIDIPEPDSDEPAVTTDGTTEGNPSTNAELMPVTTVNAGVLNEDVPYRGSGSLVLMGGEQPAPKAGPVVPFQVEVEEGVPVDGVIFAESVFQILNDNRSWSSDSQFTFARTTQDAKFSVVLATPATTDRLCRPLYTAGSQSCRNGRNVVINAERWVTGSQAFVASGGDINGYRIYVINHEVGHALGHNHIRCSGYGALANVMQQQTGGSGRCVPNGWPYPEASP
ncbi:MAG: DUF3152 domain-containing protein [Actinomycetaceae bacterium]|nr:DUF3152 domain-containing protein [Actinomycetaceae bacterium]